MSLILQKLLPLGLTRTKVEGVFYDVCSIFKKLLMSAQSAFSLCHQPDIFKMCLKASSIVILPRSSCTTATTFSLSTAAIGAVELLRISSNSSCLKLEMENSHVEILL